MGEARRRGFWAPGATPVAEASADVLYPGDEARLMHQIGAKPEHCRVALGRTLYNIVTNQAACGDCGKAFGGLDDLGAVVVAHIEVHGRLDRNSPSWPICRDCVYANDRAKGMPKPVELANRLVHEWLSRQGAKRLPHPAERRRS